jgi:large conductance mechanosensitive channel
MSVLQEFKKFALRGNVIDMAVGIIIGGAFGTVVKSLVDDVIMPPIGAVTSDVDFRDKSWEIRPAVTRDANGETQIVKPAVRLNYGAFINNVITFLIVAWAVFMLVKAVNVAETRLRLGEERPEDVPPPPEEVVLLREIRDELKRSSGPAT